MKLYKKSIVILMLVALTFVLSVSAFAAIEVKAGKSSTVTFSISGIYGIDGYFEFSNRNLFSSVTYRNNSDLVGNVSDDGVYLYGFSKTDVKIELKVTIDPKAAPSDSCNIVFHYETSDENGDMSDWTKQSQTVKVKQEEAVTSEITTPDPVTTDPPVTDPVKEIDYVELQKQLDAAAQLDESEYTKSSWDKLVMTLETAHSVIESDNQNTVDAGAKALKNAIEALVKIDYSDLRKAIDSARDIKETYANSELMFSLFDALNKADGVIAGRDQQAVDALTNEINDLVAQIKADRYEVTDTDTTETQPVKEIIKEVIKEVEVLPEGPYCNTSVHKVWPVIFFVSLAVNLMLAALIVVYILKRKRLRKDDTPIVDYNIEDDE